jgi:uncharacterized lipoprotein YddW (UPF0748 family)
VLSSLLGTTQNSYSQAQLVRENRVIFDEGLDWVTETGAHNLCGRMKRAGFNALAVCVWHGRGTSWPSRIAPWDNDRLEALASRSSNFDPLATILRVAQQYELEVHAWFTVMLRQRAFFREYYDEGTPDQAFEVHRPEFRDFISRVISECVSRYPLHGVNLDYIRSMSISKSAYCAQEYKKITGRNLTLDRLSYGLGTEAHTAIARWQARAVGEIVQHVSQSARAANPEMVLSVCANPGHPDLYIQGQDSLRWANDGLIDVIFAMHYEPELDWDAIQTQQRLLKRPESLVVLCGNYDRVGRQGTVVSRPAKHVSELLKRARTLNPKNGVALYLSGLVDDSQVTALSEDAFRVAAKTHWVRAADADVRIPVVPGVLKAQ